MKTENMYIHALITQFRIVAVFAIDQSTAAGRTSTRKTNKKKH